MVAARHINRELLAVFVATLLVLFAVAVGGRFIGYLQDAAAGKFAAGDLMAIMALRLPGFVQLIAPFAFYIAAAADRRQAARGAGNGGPARQWRRQADGSWFGSSPAQRCWRPESAPFHFG